jgi:hypothetical protein
LAFQSGQKKSKKTKKIFSFFDFLASRGGKKNPKSKKILWPFFLGRGLTVKNNNRASQYFHGPKRFLAINADLFKGILV